VINKAVFLAQGINTESQKELLGMWLAENEGAKFWLSVLIGPKNRGLQDIHAVQRFDGIRCVDCLANIGRIAEERIEIFPMRTPAFADLRIFIVPGIRELVQHHLRGFSPFSSRW